MSETKREGERERSGKRKLFPYKNVKKKSRDESDFWNLKIAVLLKIIN